MVTVQTIVTTSRMDISLLPGLLVVGIVPSKFVEIAALSIQEVLLDQVQSKNESISSIFTVDSRGLSLVLNEENLLRFKESDVLRPHIQWGSTMWKAFDIHGGDGSETASVVSYLSSHLAGMKISLLNYTTFSRDLLLVQENDIEVAIEALKRLACSFSNDSLSSSPIVHFKSRPTDYLQVLTKTLSLVSVNCSKNMVKRSLFGVMLQMNHAIKQCRKGNEDFFFALFSACNECSMLTSSDSLDLCFEPGTIVLSPRPLVPIRFCGHDFALHETGLVSLLFSPSIGDQRISELLSCSTFYTSFIFVFPEESESTLKTIKGLMTCSDVSSE